MSNDIKVIAGTTIKLINTFKDYDGVNKSPQLIKFIVRDYKQNIIDEFTLTDTNKLSEGKFFFDYTTRDTPGTFIVEFYGEITGNKTIYRKRLITSFFGE